MIRLNSYRILYSIGDAASVLGSSIDELMRHAALGNIRLCIRLPDNAVVFSLRKALFNESAATLAERQRTLMFGWSIEVPEVEVLFLGENACREIEALGMTTVKTFDSAAKYDTVFSGQIEVSPSQYMSPFDSVDLHPSRMHARVLAVYSELEKHRFDLPDAHSPGKPINFKLQRSDLLIAAADLERLSSRSLLDNLPAVDVSWDGVLPPYMSDKLQAMREASRIWINSQDKMDSKAIHSLVIKKLQSRECFAMRRRLAEDAASLIQPIYARRSKRGYEVPTTQHAVPSPELKALIIAAELWKNYETNSRPTDDEVRDRIREILGEGYPMSDRLSRQGPVLLRPEAAEDHRQKQLPRLKRP